MYRDYGISQKRPLWFDVHEDKELGWKETQGTQNIGIEDSQGNRTVDQKQVLKICENYVTELCYRIMLQNYITELCYRIMLQNYVTEAQSTPGT